MSSPQPNLHDDDQLLAQLGLALDALDPVPADAAAVARSAVDLGRADDELAELVFDSLEADGALAMRHAGVMEARALGFVAGGYRLDLELLDEGGVVLGQLDPAGPAQVDLETVDGVQQGPADDLGRFRFSEARGPLRLRVTIGTTAVILTPWISW
jgi:hypothetical protein